MLRLAAVYVHPLKSARGLRVDAWPADEMGLVRDRRLMAVDEHGRFLSQRNHPRMALLRPSLEGVRLRIEAPDMPDSLVVPLYGDDGPGREVEIWGDRVEALAVEDHGWMSRFFGFPAGLVRIPDHARRQVDPRYAREGDRVGFADGFPFLLIGQGSLDDLNGRLERPVSMERFRPNLVIEGAPPFAEDAWRRIRVGDITFEVAKPCARCVLTTVDQASGEPDGREPLRTLATYRTAEGGVMFGQNLLHRGLGTLRVGDPVTVLETR
ncbi:MAG: MOSC domain-containing protein [Myxococcota bacterium]